MSRLGLARPPNIVASLFAIVAFLGAARPAAAEDVQAQADAALSGRISCAELANTDFTRLADAPTAINSAHIVPGGRRRARILRRQGLCRPAGPVRDPPADGRLERPLSAGRLRRLLRRHRNRRRPRCSRPPLRRGRRQHGPCRRPAEQSALGDEPGPAPRLWPAVHPRHRRGGEGDPAAVLWLGAGLVLLPRLLDRRPRGPERGHQASRRLRRHHRRRSRPSPGRSAPSSTLGTRSIF